MKVWMAKNTASLFVVRPWIDSYCPFDYRGKKRLVHIGWLFQYDNGPKWMAFQDSKLITDAFEDLGDL